MQDIIAKLLEEFEQGKMSRRQLIQSLALTATTVTAVGGTPAAAAPAAADSDSAFKAVSINHVTFANIKDYTKMRDFYADLFGMKVVVGLKKDQCHLKFNDTYITFRNADPKDLKSPGPIRPTVEHIAFGIEPWDRQMVADVLKRRGIPATESSDDVNNTSIRDPQGFHVEIVAKKYETPN